MNTYKLVKDLPQAKEAPLDYAVLYSNFHVDGIITNYLVYECARDFLSAPRNYAVLSFSGCPAGAINLDLSPDEVQLEDLDSLYDPETQSNTCFMASITQRETATETNFLMIMSDHIVSVTCDKFELVEKIYHAFDAQTALSQFTQSKQQTP